MVFFRSPTYSGSALPPDNIHPNGFTLVSPPVISRHTTLLRGLPAQLQDLAGPGEMDRAYYNHSWDLPVYIIDEKGQLGMDILQPPLWDLPVYIIVASLPFSPSGSHLVFNLQPVFSSPVMFHLWPPTSDPPSEEVVKRRDSNSHWQPWNVQSFFSLTQI